MLNKLERLISKFWPVILIFGLFPATLALFVPGFFGASDDLHVAWLFEMEKSLRLGQFPPRFVPDLSYQFGYPLFNFAFPLPFYIGELFRLLNFSLVDSVKLIFLFSIFLSGMTMYLLLRKLSSSWLSLAGAFLYVYCPYRAVDLYIRGAIGEIVAFVFLPLIVLSILEITDREASVRQIRYWVGIGGLALAALVLTHNITTYMSYPFFILLGLMRVLVLPTHKLKRLVYFGVSIGLGLLISLYFWLPALLDSSLMKYDTVFNFQDHFPTLKQLIVPFWGYGASVAGPHDGLTFNIGLVNLAVIFASLGLLIWSWKKFNSEKRLILIWCLVTFTLSLMMMNYRSSYLWLRLPLLPYFQFPWRFLILTTFISPIFLIAFDRTWSWIVGLLVISLSLGLNVTHFRPQDFLGRTDNYFLNRYIPSPVASFDYTQTQEEYLRLPKDSLLRPNQIFPRVLSNGPLESVQLKNDLAAHITTATSSAMKVDYSKYAFPGWKVTIDGRSVPITAGAPYGQIEFAIPPGKHSVEIDFKETSRNLLFDLISIVFGLVGLNLILQDLNHLKSYFKPVQ